MTDNDRKLLERAAQAMGRKIIGRRIHNGVEVLILDNGDYWQPLVKNELTDCMGDALRLAVRLKLSIDTNWYNSDGCYFSDKSIIASFCSVEEENHKGDPNAATRRAIVRAAAEIGRTL